MTDLRSALRIAARRVIVLSLPQVPIGFMTEREVDSGETVRIGVGVQLSVILTSLCFSSAVGPVESFSLGIMREGRGEEVPVVVRGRLEENNCELVGAVVRAEQPRWRKQRYRRGDVLVLAWTNTTAAPRRLFASCFAVPFDACERVVKRTARRRDNHPAEPRGGKEGK